MELAYYFRLVRRWLWLWVVSMLIAGVVTYWVSSTGPAVYLATARLLVGPDITSSTNPQLNDLRTGTELMHTYAEIATTRPFLEAVSADLNEKIGLAVTPELLLESVVSISNDETRILNVNAEGGSAEQAVAIANTVAEALVNSSPFDMVDSDTLLHDELRAEMAKLQTSMAASEAKLARLEADLNDASNADAQRLILNDISEERTRQDDMRRTLVMLYDALQTTPTNQIRLIEAASIASPVASQAPLRALLGAVAGLIVGLAIAVAYDYFSNSLHSAEEVAETVGAPVLAQLEPEALSSQAGLVVRARPESTAAECYRLMGAKLLLGSPQSPTPHSMLLSSLQVDDDAGVVAANLALTLAQTGKKVTVLDANLRRPTIGRLFGLSATARDIVETLQDPAHTLQAVAVEGAPGLQVVPARPAGGRFAMLASARLPALVEQLERQSDFLIVVAAPAESLAENLVLASAVDGVILVAELGAASKQAATHILQTLRATGTPVIGSVLIDRRQSPLDSLRRALPGAAPADRAPATATSTPANDAEPTPASTHQA